jgi:glycosyltransferase involved in cell wall biosynthesis
MVGRTMKKVLILTYYWPPAGGAGVQRWLKFVKYMRQYGWEPVVYTAENGEMPVIDESLSQEIPPGLTVLKTPIWEPYTIYKRFIGRKKDDKINAAFLSEHKKAGLMEKISVWIRGNFFIPDARRFWIRPSIRYLSDYIRRQDIRYVISTGPPHSMHLIARGLLRKHPALKWIADFRDPWTNIDFYEKLMLSRRADRKHHRQELDVLKQASLVLSVGKTMSAEFREMYLRAGGTDPNKFRVITNGFDEEDMPEPASYNKNETFSIAHIGTLVKDRNPDVLWRVLSALVKEDPAFARQLEIRLVGKVDIYVREQISHYGLDGFVKKIGYLPHREVTAEQRSARVLLLLVNNTRNARGILTGKFFEYMASGTPILAIGPEDGDLAEIMNETSSGLISGFGDEETLRQNILAFYRGEKPPRNEEAIHAYSRRKLTARLCDFLDEL